MSPAEYLRRAPTERASLPDMDGLARCLAAPVRPRGSVAVDELLSVAPTSPLAAPALAPAPAPAHPPAGSRSRAAGLGAALAVSLGAALLALGALDGPAPSAPPAPMLRRPLAPPGRPLAPTSRAESPATPALTTSAQAAPPGPTPTRRVRHHPAARRASVAAATPAPALPDRAATEAAFRRVAGEVARCGDGASRRATVTATFAHTGRVTTARVVGLPAGPLVNCTVAAVRRVTLPPFARPFVTVTFPFQLR